MIGRGALGGVGMRGADTSKLTKATSGASGTVMPIRIAVVGAGRVGATFAYALLHRGIAPEIVLLDSDRRRAEGEAMDLSHAVPLTRPARVWAGDYADCAGGAVTVIAAGVAQAPGEARLGLLQRNATVFREVVPRVVADNPHAIVLVATNPVDVLTYAAWRLSGLPAARVLGSGTVLDAARFRHRLSGHFGVDPHSVHAWIVGEHRESEVPAWSLVNIAGMRLAEFCAAQDLRLDEADRDRIFRQSRNAATEISSRKGATYYAVAAALVRIVDAIVRDQRTVYSVSTVLEDAAYGVGEVCLSLPAVIGRGGVEWVLHLGLSRSEDADLRRSAKEYGDETARLIDIEIRTLVENAHARVRETLTARRAELVALAQLLIEREVVDHDQLAAVLGGEHLAAVAS